MAHDCVGQTACPGQPADAPVAVGEADLDLLARFDDLVREFPLVPELENRPLPEGRWPWVTLAA
jgi:hypothetical protein